MFAKASMSVIVAYWVWKVFNRSYWVWNLLGLESIHSASPQLVLQIYLKTCGLWSAQNDVSIVYCLPVAASVRFCQTREDVSWCDPLVGLCPDTITLLFLGHAQYILHCTELWNIAHRCSAAFVLHKQWLNVHYTLYHIELIIFK